MRAILSLALLLLCAPVVGARADTLCPEPPVPAMVDGAGATADQMRAAMADARNYISQARVYQDCLLKEVEAAKTQATAAGQPFEPMLETSARARVELSRKAQEKVSAAANSALSAYKNSHPN